jgi:hypothetical protein
MPSRLTVALCLFLLSASPAPADQAALRQDIRTVAGQGRGSDAGRAAWDRVVAAGPAALPPLLEALDTPDTVAANWLRTAFDRVAEAELAKGGKGIDADVLLAYAKDPKRQGRARRLALEVVDRLRPGTGDRLYPGWLEDPEFRFEAVALTLREADRLARAGSRDEAVAAYRKAFAASRDLQQGRTVAAGLDKLGVTVSTAEHLGFLTDWYVIGPFDAMNKKGFTTVYPPEEKVDLAAELPGKGKTLTWKRYRVREPAPAVKATHIALVNLRQPLGDADDAVAYAYTAFTVPAAVEAEFRGAADDNFTVWVNGKREFGFEEYRNGVRLDRHRFQVKLRPGRNTVLVKVCQAPANAEPNWEFLLRVVDPSGKGIAMKNALPNDKRD